MKVNIYFVPGLFLSTAIARLFPVMVDYGNYGDMAFKIFTKTMPALVSIFFEQAKKEVKTWQAKSKLIV